MLRVRHCLSIYIKVSGTFSATWEKMRSRWRRTDAHKFLASPASWSAGCLHALCVVFKQLWWWLAFWWTLISQPGECISVPGMMLLQNVINFIWYHDSFCKIHLISFCLWDWLEPSITAFPLWLPRTEEPRRLETTYLLSPQCPRVWL